MKKLIGLMFVLSVVSITKSYAEGTPCKVGEIGPGGGVVFYCGPIKEPLYPQYFTKGCKGKCVGLEAAPSDQERSLPMGSTDTQTTATGMEVGDGMDNTSILLSVIGVTSKTYQTTKPRMKTIIINDHESYDEEVGRDYKGLDGTYAALSCIYRQTENNHWFLPSKKELGLLYDTYLSLLHYQSGAEDDEVKGLSLIKHEALSQWLRDTLKGYYWSSSVDYKNNIFWGQTFDPHHNSKFLLPGSFNINVRCVRAF